MMSKVLNLKSEIIDSLLSSASTQSKENLLNEILVDYLSLIDDDRLSELEGDISTIKDSDYAECVDSLVDRLKSTK